MSPVVQGGGPLLILLTLLSLLLVPSSSSSSLYNTKSSPIAGAINVHLMPHSHDDVGWLKSPQAYFDGSSALGVDAGGWGVSVHYANGAVQHILTSVMDALYNNPDRTFVVVEQWFFQRWFLAQSDAMRARVASLLASGQLVFANGGLVMHDEACPSYIEMLDQTSAGIRWLAETFGTDALPRVTSQLDPFGHSSTQAALFASPRSGYIAQFHARVDEQESDFRHALKQMDYAWAPSSSLGLSAMTMGSLGAFGYSKPSGFCYDISIECEAEAIALVNPSLLNNPINDDAHRGLPDAIGDNVDANVAKFLATVTSQLSSYPTDADGVTYQLPWLMGDDFEFTAASYNFLSMDKLIHYVNLNTSIHNVNAFYSTQAAYADARITRGQPLSLKTSDSMPYASGAHEVWSGYFSSRSALKGFVRESSALFTAARQLQFWGAPPPNMGYSNPLWLLEQGLGVACHHDAVSGTSKQTVAFDYARRLQAGRDAASQAMSGWLNLLMGAQKNAPTTGWVGCDLANATICPLSVEDAAAGTPIVLVLFNSQSSAPREVPIRIPVRLAPAENVSSWAVFANDGITHISAQLVPASPADAELRAYYGASPANVSWLCFFSPPIPGVGYTLVFLSPVTSSDAAPRTFASRVEHITLTEAALPPAISNGIISLSFDPSTGLLSSMASTGSDAIATAVPLTQTLLYYASSSGDAASLQSSGAYILRPNSSTAYPIASDGVVVLTLVSGPIVSEAWQVFSSWATQVVRLWANDTSSFAVAWTVGPVPIEEGGKEVISRFAIAGWETGGAFATDSNGREWQHRHRNMRPDYNLSVSEFVAMNFYPANTAARITDLSSGGVLTVLTDRTQGGASLQDGALELMLHRRLVWDDGEGVMESLNEPGVTGSGLVVRGTHTVLLTRGGSPAVRAHRDALQDALFPLVVRGGALQQGTSPSAWSQALAHAPTASLLPTPLPPNVALLTLHAFNATHALVRLSHSYEVGEDAELSMHVNVSLATFLSPPFEAIPWHVTGAREMTLTGGEALADVTPVTYKFQGVSGEVGGGGAGEMQSVTLPIVPPPPAGDDLVVELAPMEIRTFLLTIEGR